jgi:hypothetical protein
MISRRVFLGRAGEIAAFGAMAGAGFSKPLFAKAPGERSDTAATFDLEVSVWGLCLFWLPRSPQTTQHVLLVAPDPRPDPTGNVEPHYPRVYYDAVYDSQVPAGQYWREVPLEGTVLDLSTFKGRETQIPAIPDLLDISPHIPQDLPDPKATIPPNLACRVTLPPGLATSMTSDGWTRPGPAPVPSRLAYLVVWTIHGIQGTQLGWKLESLKTGPGAVPVQPLTPLKPSNGKIKLSISNVRLQETGHQEHAFPGAVPCNFRMPHFKAFRHLYGGPGPWPELINTKDCPGPQGTPYTCLPSGGH